MADTGKSRETQPSPSGQNTELVSKGKELARALSGGIQDDVLLQLIAAARSWIEKAVDRIIALEAERDRLTLENHALRGAQGLQQGKKAELWLMVDGLRKRAEKAEADLAALQTRIGKAHDLLTDDGISWQDRAVFARRALGPVPPAEEKNP